MISNLNIIEVIKAAGRESQADDPQNDHQSYDPSSPSGNQNNHEAFGNPSYGKSQDTHHDKDCHNHTPYEENSFPFHGRNPGPSHDCYQSESTPHT